jgi:hypothetical protein
MCASQRLHSSGVGTVGRVDDRDGKFSKLVQSPKWSCDLVD